MGKAKNAGKVSKSVKHYVKRVLDAEVEDKIYQTGQVNASGANNGVNTTVGAFQALTEMAQGNTNSTRLGLMIKPKKLVIKWAVQAVATDCTVRLIVFRDTLQSAVTAVFADLMQAATTGTYNAAIAFGNNNNYKRFVILAERLIDLNVTGAAARSGRIEIPASQLRNIHFPANATNTLAKNKIWLFATSSLAAADANCPLFANVSELYFEDA